jgi:stage V sporulation protein G
MKISEVKIQLVRPHDGLIGFASIVINDAVYLGSIGIHRRPSGGYRLTFPKKDSFDIFYPINQRTGQIIEIAIIEKLESVMKGTENDRYSCVECSNGRF